MNIWRWLAVVASLATVLPPVWAGTVTIVDARAVPVGIDDGRYRIDVTLKHDDSGWEHYADRWEVLDPEGNVIATRVLYHPHEEEQPFTRSLAGVVVPKGVTKLRIRAHDKVHGYAAELFTIDLGE